MMTTPTWEKFGNRIAFLVTLAAACVCLYSGMLQSELGRSVLPKPALSVSRILTQASGLPCILSQPERQPVSLEIQSPSTSA